MGGYIFSTWSSLRCSGIRKLLDMNLPTRDVWRDAIHDAGFSDLLYENLRCTRDYDGMCAEHGCLQKSMAGAVCDVETLITVNNGTLSFLAENKDWCSSDSSNWVNGATDWEMAVEILELLIDKLGQLSIDKVVIWDDFTDLKYYPCPRFLPRMEMYRGWPMLNCTAKRIPYFKAKEMYDNGEWNSLTDIELSSLKVNQAFYWANQTSSSACDAPFRQKHGAKSIEHCSSDYQN